MANAQDSWLDYLVGRRSRRQLPHPDGEEYVPVTALPRPDGKGDVLVVKDEVLIDESDVEREDLRPLRAAVQHTTIDQVDLGSERWRFHGSADANSRVPSERHTPTYLAVVGGRIKNRSTASNTRERPQPTEGTVEDGQPLVVVIDTGVAAAAVGLAEQNREDGWGGGRFTLADDSAKNVDLLDVIEPAGLDIGAGHGTFVGGLIGQVTPARIVMLRALDTDGVGADCIIARAIRRAGRILRDEADGRGVLNLSFGIETLNDTAPDVLRRALEALPPDVVVVAAAGNEPSGTPFWPAAFEHVLGVAALDRNGQPTRWSNHGDWVDFSTRGVELTGPYVPGFEPDWSEYENPPEGYDTTPDIFDGPDAYAEWEGTSFAAALVSGKVANLLLAEPQMTPDAVKSALQDEAEDRFMEGYGHRLFILDD